MLGLVNRLNDISLSRANLSQAKFKSAVDRNLLQSWVNLTIEYSISKKESRPCPHCSSFVFRKSKISVLIVC